MRKSSYGAAVSPSDDPLGALVMGELHLGLGQGGRPRAHADEPGALCFRKKPGGPEVSLDMLAMLLNGELAEPEERIVLLHIDSYHSWSDAYVRMASAVPDAQGPPVDSEAMIAYLAGRLSKEQEAGVRRNIRLYRNWYDASND